MRRVIVALVVVLVIVTATAAAASGLTMVGGQNPRHGVAEAPPVCGLTAVEIVANYYIVAPKSAYYSGFDVRGTGVDAACAAFTVYVRVTHEGHAYYLKIPASDVSGAWAELGVFEAAEGQPLVYSTRDYSPHHVVSDDPSVEHSVFSDTSVVVAVSPPTDW